MALTRIKMLLIMSLLVTLWGATTKGQSQSSCTQVLLSLSPCLEYITGYASTPTSECCSQLANVAKSQPHCLCEVVNGGASKLVPGIDINQTKALALPGACKVQTPPISTCSSGTSPSSSPPSSGPVSNVPNPPSGIGSPTTQGSGNGSGSSHHGSSSFTKLPSSLLLFILAMISFVSNF
ncbi:hypothetical protein RIF29_39199 [Crotalaria pallida]|uniref:Bifunctional inhibitor/plant lipid transfer protein/seed storage helical domain-containing protein n=1 Tax=Crotalaria pallida TaxID=3830 RepID=A0AAN9E0T2_CROPI